MTLWFEQTLSGRYVAAKEAQFFRKHTADIQALRVAQFGQSWLRPSENMIDVPQDIQMNAAEMAWDTQSLDMLLLPHAHEFSGEPLLVLAEAARVLKPHGRLVLTGFNPHSLWCGCKWFDDVQLPKQEHCLPLPDLKRQIRPLGFEVEFGQFMVYVPPVESAAALNFWRFLEKAGDRWWPQCAAVYGLVLVKRVAGVTPLSELEADLAEQPIALGLARVQGDSS